MGRGLVGCNVCSMFGFYWQGIKIRWLSISDFNRRSEMEVCDRSMFELCHLTRIHVVRLSRILVGGWLPEH